MIGSTMVSDAELIAGEGTQRLEADDFDGAEACFRIALSLAPDYLPATLNLGIVLACQKREVEAEACYRRVLELEPDYRKARFNLAYLLLRQGRFAEGWHCYESREWLDLVAGQFDCPRWQGESLQGGSLVVAMEGGLGDMIQFCRYVPMLKARGAGRVGLICHPQLQPLLRSLNGVDEILPGDDPDVGQGWDRWVPILSLPYHFATRLETIPAPIPYLQADPERIAHWQSRMPERHPRVGLVWKGNPRFENDSYRSLPSLDLLAPLGQVRGIEYVSLQKGAGAAEARHPPQGLRIVPVGEALADFSDTAAAVAGLDLVIAVDTAVAHLTGALGKPCWLMLPDLRTDSRWLSERKDTPWYPETMQLFRQRPGEDWSGVVAELARSLDTWQNEVHHLRN